jgi:type II secretory pathway pseudopilin PulG
MLSINKKAYSLIEIALVIIIISIIIAGSLNGVEMIKKARLTSAQTLTQQAVIPNIKGLLIWLETSLPQSFLESERDNGLKISVWRNINPNILTTNNPNQNIVINQPTYLDNRFNDSIPGINFDGNDFLNFSGSELINSGYSFFIVEKRMSSGNLSTMIGGSSSTDNGNLVLAYRNSNTVTQSHITNEINASIPNYSSPVATIHSFLLNTSTGKKYWFNGGDIEDSGSSTQTQTLTSYANPWIGRYLDYYYFGDIAEIIIYKRSLNQEERKSIESYLSKKYNIKIQ